MRTAARVDLRGARAGWSAWLRARGGWASVVALAAPILLLGALGWALRWTADDGWINARIVQQTVAGHGVLTFNPGERVEAGTSTLWLALLLLAHLVAPGADPGVRAAVLGITLTVTAMVLATSAGLRVARRVDPDARAYVPVGTLVVACLPPFWDFATSGLETSLTFCWLALCQWLLVARLPTGRMAPPPAWWPLWPALVIGLGWLVRPEAALYAVGFAVALLAQSRLGVLSWLGALVVALLLPGAYQVFRMGYFASLVPNTAVAKGAATDRTADGLYYLLDYVVPYSVWFPVLVAGALLAVPVGRWLRERRWGVVLTVLAPVLPALLHVAYVVRVGGDFIHARFLLPPTFALMLPVAVVGVRGARALVLTAGALVAGWAVAVAGGARVAYTSQIDVLTDQRAGTPTRQGVANERAFWSYRTPTHQTLRVADWRGSDAALAGEQAAADLALGRSYYRDPTLLPHLLATSTPEHRVAMEHEIARRNRASGERPVNELWPVAGGRGIGLVATSIGIPGVVAGPDVVIVDRFSLTDAVTARARPEPGSVTRVGHRATDPAWQAAQYVSPTAMGHPRVTDAREALRCGPVQALVAATTEPMTRSRFWRNVRLAPSLTTLSFPGDPHQAREQLCGSAPPLAERP